MAWTLTNEKTSYWLNNAFWQITTLQKAICEKYFPRSRIFHLRWKRIKLNLPLRMQNSISRDTLKWSTEPAKCRKKLSTLSSRSTCLICITSSLICMNHWLPNCTCKGMWSTWGWLNIDLQLPHKCCSRTELTVLHSPCEFQDSLRDNSTLLLGPRQLSHFGHRQWTRDYRRRLSCLQARPHLAIKIGNLH